MVALDNSLSSTGLSGRAVVRPLPPPKNCNLGQPQQLVAHCASPTRTKKKTKEKSWHHCAGILRPLMDNLRWRGGETHSTYGIRIWVSFATCYEGGVLFSVAVLNWWYCAILLLSTLRKRQATSIKYCPNTVNMKKHLDTVEEDSSPGAYPPPSICPFEPHSLWSWFAAGFFWL